MKHIYNAYAKINWGLNITGRRADGYHLLDMVMQSVALCDELSLEPADALTLTVNGVPAGEENLILRAALALNRRVGRSFGARMSLVKRIPERAGMGGGSADCALALRALNALWGLGLDMGELLTLGEALGADVPFCLIGGLARVSGIGERVEPVAAVGSIPLVLTRPGDGLSTGAVFSLWDSGAFPAVRLDATALADAVARGDLSEADRLCANALTAPALSLMPEIGERIDQLRKLGASAAFMTGSGSAVVGAFDDLEVARRAALEIPGALLTETLPALPPLAKAER